MSRALVLGGGGSVGLAWEAAILGGLDDAGFDARAADVIIGTSAGSVVGACVGHGHDPRAALRERATRGEGGGGLSPNADDVAAVFRVWGAGEPMTLERCAEVGRLAMAARTIDADRWRESFSGYAWPGWPEVRLLIMAVECEGGAMRAFSAEDRVRIELAAAASCAVPGLAPTVTIGTKHYMDGGVGSWTSADLALSIRPERVLIVAPAGIPGGSGTRGLAARQVTEETALLEEAGADVRLITFDDVAGGAGKNLMDAAAIPAVAAAGDAHAFRIAAEICAWWGL